MSREPTTADVLIQTDLCGRVEHVSVANEAHPIDVVIVFIVIRSLAEKGNRCCHLQEAVSQELEALVVLAHASLNMHLQHSMLFGAVRVFGEGFQSIFCLDIQTEGTASFQHNQIRFDPADDRREGEA